MSQENVPSETPDKLAEESDEHSLRRMAGKARSLLEDETGKISVPTELKVGAATLFTLGALVAGHEATKSTGDNKPNSRGGAAGHVFKQGQAFLAEAAKPVPTGKSNNYVELGKTIIIEVKRGEPPLVLYHTPGIGFSNTRPNKANTDSKADSLVIEPEHAAIFTDLREIAIHDQSKQPDVYAMNLAGINTKFNRATDAALNLFITDQEMRERGAVSYTLGGKLTRLVLAEVNADGNLVIPGQNGQLEISPTVDVIPNKEVPQYLEEHKLEPETNRQSAGH